MELLQSYIFDRRYFHAAPPYKQVLLSQQIQIYTCLGECSPMKFCLIYRLARVGSRSIGRLINITLEIPYHRKPSLLSESEMTAVFFISLMQ